MAKYDERGKEIVFSIVYYGASERLLKDNLKSVLSEIGLQRTGKNDVFQGEISLGQSQGIEILCSLKIASPNLSPSARLLALKGVDGVIFTANSANRLYLDELERHLINLDYTEGVPILVQLDHNSEGFDIGALPSIKTDIAQGRGIMESLKMISRFVLANQTER